jgi:hypothetical protein
MKPLTFIIATLLLVAPALALTIPLTFDVVAGFTITSASLSSVKLTPIADIGANLTITAQMSSPGTVVALFQSSVNDMPFDGDAYTTTLSLPFDLSPGNYTVTVMASTSNETTSQDLTFEYLPLAAVALDMPALNLSGIALGSTMNLTGDADPQTLDKPTLRNVGNVPINLAIAADTPYSGTEKVSLSNIQVSINGTYLPLKTSYQNITVNLQPNATVPLNLRITIPLTSSAGNYVGAFKVTAK